MLEAQQIGVQSLAVESFQRSASAAMPTAPNATVCTALSSAMTCTTIGCRTSLPRRVRWMSSPDSIADAGAERPFSVIDLISEGHIGTPFPMRSGNVYLVEPLAQGSALLPFVDPPAIR